MQDLIVSATEITTRSEACISVVAKLVAQAGRKGFVDRSAISEILYRAPVIAEATDAYDARGEGMPYALFAERLEAQRVVILKKRGDLPKTFSEFVADALVA